MNQQDKIERYADLMISITLDLYTNDSIRDENKITYYQTALDHLARCLYGIKNNLSVDQLTQIGTRVQVLQETKKDVH